MARLVAAATLPNHDDDSSLNTSSISGATDSPSPHRPTKDQTAAFVNVAQALMFSEKPPKPEQTFTPPGEIEGVTHENVETHNFNSVTEAAKDDIEAKELEASLMLNRMRQERRKLGLPPPTSSSSHGSHKSVSVKSQKMETHAETVDAIKEVAKIGSPHAAKFPEHFDIATPRPDVSNQASSSAVPITVPVSAKLRELSHHVATRTTSPPSDKTLPSVLSPDRHRSPRREPKKDLSVPLVIDSNKPVSYTHLTLPTKA